MVLFADRKLKLYNNKRCLDISNVMTFIKDFRDGAFEALSVAAQAEILRSRIRRIVVRENGVYIEIFGAKPECNLGHFGCGTNSETQGSMVRTVSKMVRSEGFEPPTPWFEARYSIQLSYERVSDLRQHPA